MSCILDPSLLRIQNTPLFLFTTRCRVSLYPSLLRIQNSLHSLDTEEDCRLRMNSGEETETVCWTERILGGRGCFWTERILAGRECFWKKRKVGRRDRLEGWKERKVGRRERLDG